jgi:hypothetical protein
VRRYNEGEAPWQQLKRGRRAGQPQGSAPEAGRAAMRSLPQNFEDAGLGYDGGAQSQRGKMGGKAAVAGTGAARVLAGDGYPLDVEAPATPEHSHGGRGGERGGIHIDDEAFGNTKENRFIEPSNGQGGPLSSFTPAPAAADVEVRQCRLPQSNPR